MKDELDGKEWVIYGNSAFQMFNWLVPCIEKAGYTWHCERHTDSMGKETFGAWHISIIKLKGITRLKDEPSADKMSMKEQPYWTYTKDTESGSEYIALSNHIGRGKVSGTKVLREGLLIDLNAIGEIIGIEILSALEIEKAKATKETLEKCLELVNSRITCKETLCGECQTIKWIEELLKTEFKSELNKQ